MTDPFDDIVSGLTFDEPTDPVASVTDLADGQLLMEYTQVKRELLEAGDMLSNHPSETTADLLSYRGALIIELRRRNLA